MNPKQSMYQLVRETAQAFPKRPALLFMGKEITYEQLLTEIDKAAYGLMQDGLKAGDVMTLCLANFFETVFLFYAANKLGILLHMVHPLTPAAQMKTFMTETGSRVLFITDSFWRTYAPLIDALPIRILLVNPMRTMGFIKQTAYRLINRKRLMGLIRTERMRNIDFYFEHCGETPTVANAHGPAVYLHSGGTSGTPKTIQLSSFAINALAMQVDYVMAEADFHGRHMLAVLPMFHGFGLCMGIHGMLIFGGADTLMPKFNAEQTIQMLKKDQISYIIGVPTLFNALLNHPQFAGPHLQNLRQAYVGGDFVSPALKERFNEVMKAHGSNARLLEGYGLTEVVSVCAVNTLTASKVGTVGKPLPGIAIQVVDLETRIVCPTEQPGEIAIHGETMMLGYLGETEQASSAFWTDATGVKWLLTGDYGFFDADGYLHFKQRLKRIVKVSGMPVMPSEIETILTAYPNVREAAAIGVPDEQLGHVIRVYLALKDKSIPIDERALKQTIQSQLSVFAVPKQIIILDELPKTVTGKVDTLAPQNRND
jgi:long-chain acyl-CoA synthetase